MTIGKRIRDRRTLLKMSVDELAKKIGKDRSTVYRYESGDIDRIPSDMIQPLSYALETTPAFLMGIDHASATGKYVSENFKKWNREIGHVEFTDEEVQELINFAKYLIVRRTFN